MRITCPHCEFVKEIAAQQIPPNVVRVVCPACRQPFALQQESADVIDPTVETDEADADAGESIATETEQASVSAIGSAPEPARCEQIETASIGARYAALMIDSLLILTMVLILRTGLSLLSNGIPFEGEILLELTFILFALTLAFAYHTLFIGACGQTPGKMLMKIRVIQIDRSEMTYRRALLREVLGKTLSAPLFLGYLMALFHPQRLAAHDKIADSCVVKFKPESPRD